MTISSMTGFARAQGQADECTWTWEIKSVNSKGLDVRCRMPYGFDGLEPRARERIGRKFRRGSSDAMSESNPIHRTFSHCERSHILPRSPGPRRDDSYAPSVPCSA